MILSHVIVLFSAKVRDVFMEYVFESIPVHEDTAVLSSHRFIFFITHPALIKLVLYLRC